MLFDGEFGGNRNNELSVRSLGYCQDTLRAVMLLFDEVDAPQNNIMKIATLPDDFLSLGMAQSTRILMSGSVSLEIWRQTVLQSFFALNERDGGRWVLTSSVQSLGFPDEALNPNHAVALELLNALPMPHNEVPYDEVLSFKQRRKSELVALRTFLEELGLQAAQEGVDGLARRRGQIG